MTESDINYFQSELAETSAVLAEDNNESNDCANSELEALNVIAGSNSKNEIKVSAEGVARLTFGFLDDMQGGDSSLEPGEVKTPPPGSSPVTIKELTPSRLAQEKPVAPTKQLVKETLSKVSKTVSQLEAEACEEKVRAILELDAKQRKEELERRKLEAEKRRQSGETVLELENKRKAKEERKKLKKLKKAKKAAEEALINLDEDETLKPKKRKIRGPNESEESEGLCTSGSDDNEDRTTKSEKHCSVLNSTIAIPSVATLRYPAHLPPHLLPDAFMGGFRPLNPFMRGPRPDFAHGRGGFLLRGRGGMRGRMPFPGFRPQFFSPTVASGGQLKFNIPHGPHGMQQHRQHHTPPPNRGHSPILPPSSDLMWTKCKPSLSYSFKLNKENKCQVDKLHSQASSQSDGKWDDNNDFESVEIQNAENPKSDHKKSKKHKSLEKEKRKSKKHRDKDDKNSKRSKISRQSSSSSTKNKKKSRKSSRRKIEKIRKSYGSSARTTPTLQQQYSLECIATIDSPQVEDKQETRNDEEMPNEEEIRQKVENIKQEKLDITSHVKIPDLALKVKPFVIVKTEPLEENEQETEQLDKVENHAKIAINEAASDKTFDIFAQSQVTTKIALECEIKQAKPSTAKEDEEDKELISVTPPLPPINNTQLSKSSLQNALEIQKRIDKLLQQDDIKLEAIEAAKNLLMKKTQKHQSSKEKLTPERESDKAVEQKSTASEKLSGQKHESSSSKEKPKAYKDKESHKKSKENDKEKDKDKEKEKHSSKRIEDKDKKQHDTYSSLHCKEKSKTSHKDDKNDKNADKDKDKEKEKEKTRKAENENDKEKEKSRKSTSNSSYRNPFKRSISRDKFFGKIDSRRRSKTRSREREFSAKRRLSNDRKRGDSSGYSSSRLSSKTRNSGCRSKSGERDIKGSIESLNCKEKERKSWKRDKTPETKSKRKRSLTPKRSKEKSTDISTKSKKPEKGYEHDYKSTTPPPPRSQKIDENLQEKQPTKESKKTKSPVKTASKKRPLSFTQTEFLFPEDGNEDDFILGDDEETNDSFKNLKSNSDKEDSPDTDDYMDNWENDEDVDIDMNSNMPTDISTPQKSPPDLTEEDSFVTRFVNPSPPKEVLEKQTETITKVSEMPLTPPLELLKKFPRSLESKEVARINVAQPDMKKPELFGMQELYDQFIKSVEATGVDMKTSNKEQSLDDTASGHAELAEPSNDVADDTKCQKEDPLSTSSGSTSSSSSSSSSSSDSNSSSNSSSSSSSDSSSEDSNDSGKYTKATKQSTKIAQPEKTPSPKRSVTENKKQNGTHSAVENSCNEICKREPRTPSPSPLQTNLAIEQTPPTPASQSKTSPKSDVAKDFKKLKNLEANLSRIQLMRANYDSNDEISEELHKMEILFLQEKKIILQKYAKNTQSAEKTTSPTKTATAAALPANDFATQTPLPPPPAPTEEPNKIFDANREAIKLTISPLKLSTKPAIFNMSLNEETEKKVTDDKEEFDFTEKLVKPAKEVAIVKPMMESKESKESRTRESHRHRRSPVYGGSRERQRSPNNYRDRNRRSSSRNRFSPQRRGRGRSLSLSPPRRGMGMRHGSPPRRGAPGNRFRSSNRRSRSRSRSPFRQFANRRGKDVSPLRRKRGMQQDVPSHYKKFGRQRGSRSRSPRSPQARPRSPRTPPPRRRSYSQDPFSRSPLPFKPPSPPMRRSMSPAGSSSSLARRSRSPGSPHRPRSPRSPVSPRSLSPRSPRSPDSPPSRRYDDHRYRRDNSFERHSSISPHPQYFTPDSLSSSASSQASPYFYNVSPNRISLDARINIVLNTPSAGDRETPPAGYEGYGNYTQYGGAAYMSIPPQPMAGTSNNMGYYPNPYVPMLPSTHDVHHSVISPHALGMQHSLHPPPPHVQQQQHPTAYSNIPTISSSGTTPTASSPLPPNNFYYNDYNAGHQVINPLLKEKPKAPVAVQKGNVLEIVPSNTESSQSPQIESKAKASPVLIETIKNHIDKIASISWKDEVNNRHIKSAVMRLNRGGDNSMRSILKRTEAGESTDKIEKKKVYFEDGIYPSRDSDDEDRKLVEYKIRKKVLRLRKKRGIDVPAARELIESKVRLQKPKIDAALEKLPPPPPPAMMPPPHLEQPTYLRPPTPVPLVYFHFDSVVHSMYVSQLEKPIPPRLLNPKCVPPGATAAPSSSGNAAGAIVAPNNSPNPNLQSCGAATSKKELTTLAALNRVGGRNDNTTTGSPKTQVEVKQDSPNSTQHSPQMQPVAKTIGAHFTPLQTSPQMSPLHGPVVRHAQSPIGFVGMRVNSFIRLPPSPLTRAAVPPHMQAPPPNMVNIPHGMVGMRHPHYNMPPPNLMPPNMQPDANYNPMMGGSPYGPMPTQPPPGFQGYGQRPMNPGYFMGAGPGPAAHPMHPPPMPANSHAKGKDNMHYHTQHHHHHPHPHPPHPHQHPHQQYHHNQHKPPPPLPTPMGSNVAPPSPQVMIAPYNVKKTVN